MIILNNVNKEYKIKEGIPVKALSDINIIFPDNGFYSILGRSGAGKTTLLNCIAGIDKVTSGSIIYNGIDVCKLKGKRLDDYREEIAFVFQDYNLLSEYTVEENIALSVQIQGKTNDCVTTLVNEALDKVGLTGYNKRRITELSGGQQQRIAIARALAKNSKVIFCDEPTGNLDETTSRELFDLLKTLSKDILIILVTHNNRLAIDYSDGIVEIDNGNIVSNTIKELDYQKKDNSEINIKKRSNKKFYSKLVYEQIKNLKFISILILILFIWSFTVFTVFKSVSSFDKTEAFVNTLKNNNQTVLRITTYRDFVLEEETEEGLMHKYGTSTDYLTDVLNATEDLKKQINGRANLYNSYEYIKTFGALFGIDYPFETNDNGDDFIFHYHAFNFENIIAIDDFDNFLLPLVYGDYPKDKYDILIYDYMADNMIYHKAFDCEMKDLIGKTIKDEAQGFELRIAGIVKSNYKEYEYTDGVSIHDEQLGLYYLGTLKAIYVKTELIREIKTNIKPLDNVRVNNINGDSYNNIKSKAIKPLPKDMSLDYILKDDNSEFGVVLTINQVKQILGLDHKPTNEEIEDFYKKFDYHSYTDANEVFYINLYFMTSNSYGGVGFYTNGRGSIYGIVDGNALDDNYLYFYGDIEGFDGDVKDEAYLSLNKDFSYAKEILELLEFPNHDEKYFENCIKNRNFYDRTGFCIYDSSEIIIDDASEYIDYVSYVAKDATMWCYFLIVIGIIGFCILSIKKQTYKIGILKSLGAKNIEIGASFVLTITAIAILAYIISIPLSFIVMNKINSKFINTYEDVNLIIFSIDKVGLIIPLIITLAITLFTSLVTYLSFTFYPPVKLIRYNKEK